MCESNADSLILRDAQDQADEHLEAGESLAEICATRGRCAQMGALDTHHSGGR